MVGIIKLLYAKKLIKSNILFESSNLTYIGFSINIYIYII